MSSSIALYTKTWLSSGAGLFAQELARGIATSGSEVVMVAPAAEDARFEQPHPNLFRVQTRPELRAGGRVARLTGSLLRALSSAVGVLKARLRTRLFLVSIPDPLLFAIPILLMLKLTGAKIIYIVHDPRPHSWKLKASLRWLEKAAYACVILISDGLIVLSNAAKDELLRENSIGSRKIAVIEHGVFILGDRLPAPGNSELLLFGTLRENKGIAEGIQGVIAARKGGSPVRLIIAGEPHASEGAYFRRCLALAESDPDGIEFHEGYVSDAALESFIDRCDAFLLPYLPSFHSQSGVAILAASNGRSVIASQVGGIGDLIADGLSAISIEAPAGAGETAKAVLAFMATPIEIWNDRASVYRAHMISTRSWPVIGRQYIEFCEQVSQ